MAGPYAKQVISLYDRKILQAQLKIEPEVRHTLTCGLETVFDEVRNNKVHNGSNCFANAPSKLLEKPLDYDAMRKIAEEAGCPRSVSYLRNTFNNNHIKTYGDLFMLIDSSINSRGDAYPIRSRKRTRDVLRFRHMGNQGLRTLYTHLNGLGIKIFGDDYRPKQEIFHSKKSKSKVHLTQSPGGYSLDYEVSHGDTKIPYSAWVVPVGNPPIYPVIMGRRVYDYGTSPAEAKDKAYKLALKEAQILAQEENTKVIDKTAQGKFPEAVALAATTHYTKEEILQHRRLSCQFHQGK